MYRNKKKIVIGILCIVVLIMVVVYAAFNTRLTINGTGNITSTWNIEITSITSSITGTAYNITEPTYSGTNATFNAGLKKPGDKIEYNITITNNGSIDAIINTVDIKTTGSYVILYTVEGIQNQERLASKGSKIFKIIVEFDREATSIPSDTTKEIIMNIECIQDDGQQLTPSDPNIDNEDTGLTLVNAILRDNQAQSDESIDFSKTSEEDGTKGLYYTNKNTEDNKTTYYFRGAVENNYVKFGVYQQKLSKYRGYYSSTMTGGHFEYDTLSECQNASSFNQSCTEVVYANSGDPMYWRIVRINEDGSIRLIYQGIAPNIIEDGATIGEYNFNIDNNDNAYVGYMYGTPGSSSYEETHANINDSIIKTALDTWYDEYLLSYASYMADSGFCGDRSIYKEEGTGLGYEKKRTFYASYNRLENINQPQFICLQSNDLYTIKNSVKGNKALDYPIGLITADEIVYAGGSRRLNESCYLNIDSTYFTMNPFSYDYGTYIYSSDSGTLLDSKPTTGVLNVALARPVINLKATVEISSGDGTSSNPYVIKTS